jgi:YD repeat-containing protein
MAFTSISRTAPALHRLLTSAIEKHEVLRFTYDGHERLVEPQTFGMDWDDQDVLRAYQISGGCKSGQPVGLKLFAVAEIAGLRKTGQTFKGPRPEHNPNDSAMRTIYATLD